MNENELKKEFAKSKHELLENWNGSERIWDSITKAEGKGSFWKIKLVVPVALMVALLVMIATYNYTNEQQQISDQEIYSFYVELMEPQYDGETVTAYDDLGVAPTNKNKPGV